MNPEVFAKRAAEGANPRLPHRLNIRATLSGGLYIARVSAYGSGKFTPIASKVTDLINYLNNNRER